ncbi:hypothetical protein [Streptomyces tropicalis]|uniref:PE-PGRS family protein n=1 Tax=Streptomyces tropicalis TaxID=3034234 RepID=A0ABT6A968_9ACTN|nr:hypothetical protein [Streptomyces tropicalis]MDF3301179.1 hypothetical protein [Streptomyces tropicalis]
MPTYHEIMTTDLTALTTAAARWEGMAGEFGKQETAYRHDVHRITMGPSWVGLSADAANTRFHVTLKEFQYAQTEAKAVASLLRDAHTQLAGLQKRLRSTRQDAVDAGMTVSDRGVVSRREPVPPPGAQAGPDHGGGPQGAVWHGAVPHGAVPHGARTSVQAWQDRIDQVVRAVADADAGVGIALKAVVADGDVLAGGRGFNGRATGDIERYEAEEAGTLLARLSGGGRLSGGELAALQRAFRDNSSDPVFSRTLLDGLGVAGTIRLTNEIDDLVHVRPGARAAAYATVETGLADTLASATRDTGARWYRHWREDLRHAGVQRYATDAQGVRLDRAVGYQSLVTLMRKGHGYGRPMLEDLTDDMIAAERREPGIWRLKGEYAGRRDGWFANDPVDGALGIMSRDPGTAAHYLGDDARMKYLMKDRDWNVTLHEHGGGGKGGEYRVGLDGDDRAGFGAALQAAATGLDPSDRHAHYVAHTRQNDAVLRSALGHLAEQGDDMPASLRRPMADVLVNHGATVHASMSEIDIARSPLKQDDLFEVTKQISKDKDAYGTLNGGLNQAMVSNLHADHPTSTEPLVRAGRTVGFLEEARIQAQGDPKTAAFETKPLFDKAISYIPVVSGNVQEGFDYVTDKWLEDEQKRLDEEGEEENISHFQSRNGQLTALAQEWSRTHRLGSEPDYAQQDLVERSAEAGIHHARGMSGEVAK